MELSSCRRANNGSLPCLGKRQHSRFLPAHRLEPRLSGLVSIARTPQCSSSLWNNTVFSLFFINQVHEMSENGEKNCLFCQTNSPKLKDIKFIMIGNREKQQVFTSEKLWACQHFCLIKYINNYIDYQHCFLLTSFKWTNQSINQSINCFTFRYYTVIIWRKVMVTMGWCLRTKVIQIQTL